MTKNSKNVPWYHCHPWLGINCILPKSYRIRIRQNWLLLMYNHLFQVCVLQKNVTGEKWKFSIWKSDAISPIIILFGKNFCNLQISEFIITSRNSRLPNQMVWDRAQRRIQPIINLELKPKIFSKMRNHNFDSNRLGKYK